MDLSLKRNINNKSPTVKIITPRRRINRRMSILKTSSISFDNKSKSSGTPVGKRLKIDLSTPILNNDDIHTGAGLEVEVVLGYSNYGTNEVTIFSQYSSVPNNRVHTPIYFLKIFRPTCSY